MTRPIRRFSLGLFPVLALLACDAPTAADTTGLRGLVTVGPTRPVCLPDVPCEESVSATLEVHQGSRLLRVFTSDERGLYSLALPPGDYVVVPRPGGPIPFAESQQIAVRVERVPGLTVQDLRFSTGLR